MFAGRYLLAAESGASNCESHVTKRPFSAGVGEAPVRLASGGRDKPMINEHEMRGESQKKVFYNFQYDIKKDLAFFLPFYARYDRMVLSSSSTTWMLAFVLFPTLTAAKHKLPCPSDPFISPSTDICNALR